MTPLFFVIYLKYAALGIPFVVVPFLLLVLLTYSEVTDFLDGHLARKHGLVSDLGKLLDPMADSITRISLLLILTQGVIRVPLYWVLLFLYRDLIISTLRTLCALKGVTLAARTSGKIKAILQAIVTFAIVVLMIPYAFGWLDQYTVHIVSSTLVAVVSLYTIGSGIEYFIANWKYIREFWVVVPSD